MESRRDTVTVPNVKTAFDVVKPGIIAEILKETGGHEWMSAALLEEMKNLKG